MNRHDRRAAPPGPVPPPPNPFLFQLASNHAEIMKQVAGWRAQGQHDLAAICALTKDKTALAAFGSAVGQTLKPIEYDPDQQGGLTGAGPRGQVVATLRKIFGGSFDAARELERKDYRPEILWCFIYLPSGDYQLIRQGGGLT